ncbi:peroxisomal succinyl-coenzyme A thioesterase-like [Ahaetulla prasina]|uniref:peroxisomal succinyl-coenzyme A thioesterase-like n=1 Tax=Ahaetulla prasina TaxID=499056 RepID=UPI002647076C|nr:peroxisomal succinyl-coenzyme A thioesterase-like [Ahaetulla prasina]
MAARILILPSPACLFDDPVQVKIEGLSPLQEVTVSASLVDESGNLFQSHAYYRAEGNGDLDLSCSPSLGGSYCGIEPMGLLWTLKSTTPYKRLRKTNVLTPFCVTYEVYHGPGVGGLLLGSCRSERRFMAEGVERVPVREGRLRATLFCPPGPGPFPALIDLYGSTGGLVEYRASLLASRGFVTLALAFLAFEDLPAYPEFIDLDYFGEAIKFLQKQQKVKSMKIGVLGLSKGADLALALAAFSPDIQAAVSISGSGVNTFIPLKVKGHIIPPHPCNLEKLKATDVPNVLNVAEIMDDPKDPSTWPCRIPVEKSLSKYLFICGQDDKNWKSQMFCQGAVSRLQQNGCHVEFYCYPGAGHLLEPPYMPLCSISFHKVIGILMAWGGKWKEHAEAQEDAWQRILAFFRQHLLESTLKSTL